MRAGRPPLSHATAETAVATLRDSRFKAELQAGLEACKAELGDSRRASKGDPRAPSGASAAELADIARAGRNNKLQAAADATKTRLASDRAANSALNLASEANAAQPAVTGEAAKADVRAPSEASSAKVADSGRDVMTGPQAAAAKPRQPALESITESVVSEGLPSRGRPPLGSPAAPAKTPAPGAMSQHNLMEWQSSSSFTGQIQLGSALRQAAQHV